MDGNEFSMGDRRAAQQLAASYGGMAFMRRGQRVEQAYRLLMDRLAGQRDEMLDMVRLRLATLAALIGGRWERLGTFLAEGDVESLSRLHDELKPTLRVPLDAAEREGPIRRALEELRESMGRFNRRWSEVLAAADLTDVNRRRDEYNRNYVIEKECATGSPLIARQEFRKLEPLSAKDLHLVFPIMNEFESSVRS